MATTISPEEVKHIAKLANLKVSNEELGKYSNELSETINYMDILNKLDLSDVKILTQITGQKNRFREDKVKNSLPREEVLTGTKNTYNGYFVVPNVLGDK